MKRLISLTILAISLSAPSYANIDKKELTLCLSAREYFTTYNFLKTKKQYALKESQSREISDKVSKGCSGSARRFIKVVQILTKAQLDSSSAIKYAIDFANETEERTDAFLKIFTRSFVKEFFDLDLGTAVDIALKLSLTFEGDPKAAQYDFEKLARFCTDRDELDLPKKKCADIATRVTLSAAKFKVPLSDIFISMFKFMMDEDGPNLPAFKSVEMSAQLTRYGPKSFENFKKSFEFSTNKRGLNMTRAQGLLFAKRMAERSFQESKK